MTSKSMREQLEDAWVEEKDEDADEIINDEIGDEIGDEGGDGRAEPSGEPTVSEDPEEETEEEGEGGQERDTHDTVAKPSSKAEDSKSVEKAPVSWTPAAREHWKGLPADLKAMISKREHDFALKIQETSQEASLARTFKEATRPYEHFFAADGIDAVAATKNLMQTAAGLRAGTPTQKAAIVREIIGTFGVDIGMLDTMISGQQVADTGQDSHLEQMLSSKLAPVMKFMDTVQGRQAQYQQGIQETARNSIIDFANTHEFYEDLRLDMADITDLALKRGQKLSLEDIYSRAIQMRPDIKAIVDQRAAAQTSVPKMAGKRRAAASVVGGPGTGARGAAVPTNLRDQLEAAWDGDLDD